MEFTQFVSSALDNRQQVDAVYTYLTKAFDRVHHCVLLKKLEQYGFCDAMGDLMKSFMFSRYQFVECSGCKSDLFHAKSGVTQGSTLGHLLFLIYYNDVVDNLNCSVCILADDLKMARIISSFDDCLVLQDSLDSLVSWCDLNRLRAKQDEM